jgi:hypothetical protein
MWELDVRIEVTVEQLIIHFVPTYLLRFKKGFRSFPLF